MENACCTRAAIHNMTTNKLFSANKALVLCGVIQALRRSTIWTVRWNAPSLPPPRLSDKMNRDGIISKGEILRTERI
jgi:hypothetical protein